MRSDDRGSCGGSQLRGFAPSPESTASLGVWGRFGALYEEFTDVLGLGLLGATLEQVANSSAMTYFPLVPGSFFRNPYGVCMSSRRSASPVFTDW